IQSDPVMRKRALEMVTPEERAVLKRVCQYEQWATTLRADVVFDHAGRAKVLEVNSDNVAGVEAIDLLLRYYIRIYNLSNESDCTAALNGLNDSFFRLVHEYWQFVSKSTSAPLISVCFQDRQVSFFAAHYLSKMLSGGGMRASAARPEHLRWIPGSGVLVKNPIWGESKVDILWKHWLAYEMYERWRNRRRLRPQFEDL